MKKAIEINGTTCQICGNETDWDVSFGRENFTVCPHCFERLTDVNPNLDYFFDMIFTMSDIRTESKTLNA